MLLAFALWLVLICTALWPIRVKKPASPPVPPTDASITFQFVGLSLAAASEGKATVEPNAWTGLSSASTEFNIFFRDLVSGYSNIVRITFSAIAPGLDISGATVVSTSSGTATVTASTLTDCQIVFTVPPDETDPLVVRLQVPNAVPTSADIFATLANTT